MRDRWKTITAALLLALTALIAVVPAVDAQTPIQRGARLQNAATATGNGSTLDTSQMSAVTFQVTGTFSGTVTFEGSNDGSTFVSLTCYSLDSATSTSTATTTGMNRCNVLSIPVVRARVSAYTSGSITVVAAASSAQGMIRDTIPAVLNLITGQLRGTQTTAPTVGIVNGGGSMQASTADQIGGGSDSFMRVKVREGLTAEQRSSDLMATFATTWAAVPSCTAAVDFARTYNYYIYAVTPTTTTVTVRLTGGVGIATSAVNAWPPHGLVSIHCAGVQ